MIQRKALQGNRQLNCNPWNNWHCHRNARVCSAPCCTQQLYNAQDHPAVQLTGYTYVTGSANDSAPAWKAFNSLLSP